MNARHGQPVRYGGVLGLAVRLFHACESRQRQVGGSALSRFCSNIFSMTRGTMPRFADVAVLWPDVVPIVNVLPEPVWPYASTVALYPAKMPSSRGRTLVL